MATNQSQHDGMTWNPETEQSDAEDTSPTHTTREVSNELDVRDDVDKTVGVTRDDDETLYVIVSKDHPTISEGEHPDTALQGTIHNIITDEFGLEFAGTNDHPSLFGEQGLAHILYE